MKRILFLTGTRADFGKLKSLIQALEVHPNFEPFLFVTGMHLQHKYGYTLLEIERCGFSNVHTYENHTHETTMDLTLAKTIQGLSAFVKQCQPNMIVIHGDRVETLAGSIVGALNNILVAHIEGGEVSGTIDELIRHATSKMSHLHLVSNLSAKKRLEQMGELSEAIVAIGSPDVDIMFSKKLPGIKEVKAYYEIPYTAFGIVMFHPVTTEFEKIREYADNLVAALLQDHHNYVVVFPNNDLGSQLILDAYQKLQNHPRFRIFPSIRFEYFLTLLKKAKFIIGNSSAGIREAPYYGLPIINIGSRQQNRAVQSSIINVDYDQESIQKALAIVDNHQTEPSIHEFGEGNSAELFIKSLERSDIWQLNHQKQFRDI
jgi:UDP-N-acetylglucosamine 2-epimerase (hydrolysing)